MLHAKPRPGLRARALPILLLSACGAAFGGLVALAPAADRAPSVLAYADAPVTLLEQPAELERQQARASRSRRLDQLAAAKAAAEAKAKAEAAAKAAAAAKAKAQAAAKAKAEAAARAKASRSSSRAAARISGRCPVPNASFTDTWGAPRSGGRSHQGTDMLAPYGSPVYAVASGRVRTDSSGTGGLMLYVDADNGESYAYLHNSANVARNGDRVEAGELVARVGSTGNAGGTNHVHFEREVGGRKVNPYDFLRRIC